MKTAIKIILNALGIVLSIYIVISVAVSIFSYGIIMDVYNKNDSNYENPAILNSEIAEDINVRNNGYIDQENKPLVKTEKFTISPPVFIHCFTSGTLYYTYTYEAFDENGELLTGGASIPVQIKMDFTDWNWVMTEYHEPPY